MVTRVLPRRCGHRSSIWGRGACISLGISSPLDGEHDLASSSPPPGIRSRRRDVLAIFCLPLRRGFPKLREHRVRGTPGAVSQGAARPDFPSLLTLWRLNSHLIHLDRRISIDSHHLRGMPKRPELSRFVNYPRPLFYTRLYLVHNPSAIADTL